MAHNRSSVHCQSGADKWCDCGYWAWRQRYELGVILTGNGKAINLPSADPGMLCLVDGRHVTVPTTK